MIITKNKFYYNKKNIEFQIRNKYKKKYYDNNVEKIA